MLPPSPSITDLPQTSPDVMVPHPTEDVVTLSDLPSIGSLGHFAGQCSRCCFHPKGRCLNGYDCRFCHFDHDKRRRKKKVTNASAGRIWSPNGDFATLPAAACAPPGLGPENRNQTLP